MNNNARMLVLAPMLDRRTTLQGVAPAWDEVRPARDEVRPVEDRDTAPYPCAVPVFIDDEDNEDTGVYEIGSRKPLLFDCDVAGENEGV